ncbi:hypothetical protein P7K49_005611 [Saguinus oedipus]|uniref:Uncharacterized protein n=1 Tax=Saguinus oedipus TaxID=9490 RepID=A0ABQ9W026_SAGOE|nr:hypothetical protein P7K49_005611 [Saguinus oedipus]
MAEARWGRSQVQQTGQMLQSQARQRPGAAETRRGREVKRGRGRVQPQVSHRYISRGDFANPHRTFCVVLPKSHRGFPRTAAARVQAAQLPLKAPAVSATDRLPRAGAGGGWDGGAGESRSRGGRSPQAQGARPAGLARVSAGPSRQPQGSLFAPRPGWVPAFKEKGSLSGGPRAGLTAAETPRRPAPRNRPAAWREKQGPGAGAGRAGLAREAGLASAAANTSGKPSP